MVHWKSSLYNIQICPRLNLREKGPIRSIVKPQIEVKPLVLWLQIRSWVISADESQPNARAHVASHLIQEMPSTPAKTSCSGTSLRHSYCDYHLKVASKHRWLFKGPQLSRRINSSCPMKRFLRELSVPPFIDECINVNYKSRLWIKYNYTQWWTSSKKKTKNIKREKKKQ